MLATCLNKLKHSKHFNNELKHASNIWLTFSDFKNRLKLRKVTLSDSIVKTTSSLSLNYVNSVPVPVQHITSKSLRGLVKLYFAFRMQIFVFANDRSTGADMIKTYSSKRCWAYWASTEARTSELGYWHVLGFHMYFIHSLWTYLFVSVKASMKTCEMLYCANSWSECSRLDLIQF